MSLVVEDGTGLSMADAYVAVADFRSYCGARGYALGTATDAELEQKIRLATDYIDTLGRYKGQKLSSSQALEFPRSGLSDFSGMVVSGLPSRVVRACCELSFKAMSGELHSDLDRGGKVKSESVGPLSRTYADDAPAGKVFTAAAKLLEPYMHNKMLFGSPAFVETEAVFTMNDSASSLPSDE